MQKPVFEGELVSPDERYAGTLRRACAGVISGIDHEADSMTEMWWDGSGSNRRRPDYESPDFRMSLKDSR